MAGKRLLSGLIFCLASGFALATEPPATVVIGTPPQPVWSQLNANQKAVLAPLAKEWDAMSNVHRKKWLGIAERYPSMKPEVQSRMQSRMQQWANLTPDQRAKIRATYKDFEQLTPEQKKAAKEKWKSYSNPALGKKQEADKTGNGK